MSTEYRWDIQGLRGLAVLLVVLYHAGMPWLAGGYVGVDVFFVISGYVICGLLYRELAASERNGARLDLMRFYARRMRRLLPAASVVIVATLGAAWYIEAPIDLRIHAVSGAAAALYVSNFRFAFTATDYLGESSENDPFLHTWSLGVEEQFYLVWPLLLWALYRTAPARHRHLGLGAGIAMVGAASWLACDYWTAYNRPWGFFAPWTRAWEFALGALMYCLVQALPWRSRLGARLLAGGGMASVIVAAAWFDDGTRFPGAAAVLPAAGAAALLLAPALAAGGAVDAVLKSRVMSGLGDLSYSWYLWHWPVLVYARTLFDEPGAAIISLAGIGSLALAWATFRFVEDPIRSGRAVVLRPPRWVVAGLAMSCVAAGTGFLIMGAASTELQRPQQQMYQAATADRAGTLTGDCHRRFVDTEQPECRFGSETGKKTVVLFGDSHAHHWFPALDYIAERRHWTFFSWTKSACPSVLVETFQRNLGRRFHECQKWRSTVMQRIVDLRPDLVVLANASSYLWDEGEARISRERWEAGLAAVLERLEAAGIAAVVLGDTPWPGFNVPKCLSRAVWRGLPDPLAACAFARNDRNERAIDALMDEVVGRVESAAFISGRDLVCPSPACAPMVDDTVVYHDHSHMTATFARRIGPALEAVLAGVAPELFRGADTPAPDLHGQNKRGQRRPDLNRS